MSSGYKPNPAAALASLPSPIPRFSFPGVVAQGNQSGPEIFEAPYLSQFVRITAKVAAVANSTFVVYANGVSLGNFVLPSGSTNTKLTLANQFNTGDALTAQCTIAGSGLSDVVLKVV